MDFKEIATRVPILRAASFLGFDTKSFRAPCPACNRGGERALQFFEDTQRFKCWASGAWGDSISLVAHVKDVKLAQAAEMLATHFPERGAERPVFDREKYSDSLDRDHELLESSGISPDAARRFDIGVSKKGVHQGRIVFPLYVNGKFFAYASASDIRLPKLAPSRNQS